MNKVFRVIWSQATQSWVAVSELTKAHKKQSSSNKQKSADGFSGKVIKYSAIALSLLSGHSVYAALNQPGTGDGNGVAWGENSTGTGYAAVAIGKGALSSSNSTVALGQDAKATGSGASALSVGATASGNNTVAISYKSNASGTRATAIGEESNASSEDSIALGYKTQATSGSAVAIGREVVSSGDSAVALGKGSKATGRGSLALANKSNATGNDSYAIGWSSDASAESTMAFGHSSKAKKNYDIAFGRGAETRDQGAGHSIAIGYGASAASNRAGLDSNPNSTGTLNSAGGVAIGTGAYTGINRNNTAINSSVAVGAGAGAGYRGLGADGLPTGNGTDPDDNATVLVKAFGGTTSTLDYFKNTGSANGNGFFSYQNVDINEATAVGRNTRAIGDQSVAIGAQSIAGQGSIVIGGNDIQAYDGKKYFKAANPTSGAATTVNDFNAETTPGTGKNNQPITIRDKYAELVGAQLDNSYRASYGQDGSTVIGMQAHSTTPLGVAIGTNSIVRKGAFGATAIGSGASVVANAEAAVAIGMGAEAQGNYAVAAGTAAKAKESAVAAGYQAKADESAVAVGDSSKAATSSVAVGKGAVSEKVSDIAIGQGANAKGEQGAIAMGLGTIAQGHSSIMIGGSDISTAANQPVTYSREKITGNGTPELYDGTITEVINGKTVTRTVKLVRTETVTGKKLSDAYREITGYRLNTDSLNYNSPDNKNGHASISMGIHSLSKGDMGVAIGTAARADALGSLALGTGAHASMQNSVAIGTGAVADEVSKGTRQTDISYDENGNVVGTNSPRAKYTFKWAGGTNTSEGDVVSFGTPGAERQLKNVAAGRVAEDSTDAVNGSQLNAITRSLSQTITNGWQVGGNNKFRVSNIGNDGRVNFLDGLGTAVNIAEINQAEDIDGNKLVKIWGDFYKASDFTGGTLKAGAQKVAAAKIKKQPTGANVTFDVKEVNSTLSVTPVGLKVTTGEVTANPDGTMNTPFDETTKDDTKDHTTKAKNAEVTATMNAAEDALLASQKEWREKNDAYQRTELAYLAAEADLTKGNEAVEAIQADIVTTQTELKTAQDILARDKAALARAQADANNNPNDIQKQSVLHKANEKVESTQFLVDQRERKLAHQRATLTERQSQVSMLEQEKTKADTVRNTAKGVHEEANNDLTKKKEAFDTAKKAFVDAGANQIATVQNVADSINASGWTLQQGTTDKDLVQPGDKVSFVDGDGTTVSVETADNKKTSTIKYSVNLGDGLEKTDDNKIKAKAGNGVTVGSDGIKVNTGKGLKIDAADGNKVAVDTDGTTITVGDDGKVKAVTGSTEAVTDANKGADEKAGQVRPVEANKDKLATVDTVAKAVNSAKWMAKATNTDAEITDTDKTNDATGEGIAAGDEVTFTAGKNLRVKRDGKNFTFATAKDVSFDSVKVGDTQNGKAPVNLTTGAATTANNNEAGKAPTTALNISSGTDAKPTQLVGVGSVLNKTTINTTPAGSTPADLVDLKGTNEAPVNKNAAATVGDLQNMGWKVSSDKTTGADGAYLDVVKNADEVKFVGKNAAKVSGKTENGVRTITVDVEVPDVKTAELVSSKDGSVIAPSTNPELQTALKDAKDELAAAATPEQKAAAENKVKAAETALSNAVDNKGVATAKNVADMINASGFTLKTSATTDGKKDDKSTGSEVIKPGKAVEMVAGKNLTVKQEEDGKVTYSLNPELSNLTSAEFKGTDANAPTTKLTNNGVTITPATTDKSPVSLTENGLNNGGNAITNVAGNLDGAKKDTTAPTTSATKPTALTETNAATVGDVLNAGWNLQGNSTAKDFVTAYDTVNFVDGDGTTVSVETADNKKTSTIKYSVNLGDGLEKTDDNKIKAKAGNGVTVGSDGIKVNTGKGLKIDAADGNKVAVDTDGTTITVGDDGKVKAVTGSTEAVTDANKGADEKAGQVRPVEANKDKLATVDTVAKAVNSAKWMAKATNTDAEITDTDKTNDATGEGIAAGDEVTFTAGKNLRVKRDGKNFTFATAKDVSFDSVKVGDTQNGKAPVNLTTGAATTANNNEAGKAPTTALNISSGTDAKPTQLVGVGSVLNKTTINTTPAGSTPADLVDLKGTNEAPVNKNAAATVGDLQNMGWKVSSDKTTGADGAYLDVVKNADEVKFVGEGTAIVSGKTDDKGVRTITVKVDDQVSTNNAVKPVEYTKADGTKVYPTDKKDAQGNLLFNTKADGTGTEVPSDQVITSINGPKGTTSPTTLANVKNNIPNVNDGTEEITTADGTVKPKAADKANINKAPLTAEDAAKLVNPKNADGTANPNYIGNNAATVSDVLNAGWNLQNNGAAKDFVKPFDTVNFVNGGNTTAVVTTKEDGTASDVTFNVTGLPIATTIATPDGPVQLTKVGDNYYPVKADGTPDIKTDTDGNPTNGYVKADNGNYYPAGDVTFTKDPATKVTTVTPKDGKQPVTFGNSLTNPNVVNTADAPNKAVAAPTTLNNVKGNLPTVNDADKTAHNVDGTAIDGKNNTEAPITAKDAANLLNPYKVDKDGKYLDANGNITTDPAQRVANPNFVGNNAATVSDVLNAGWNLQNNGTAKDFVKPYDTVNFINGANTTAVVTTNAEGTASNVTYNVTGLPVTYTTADGTPVSKIGDKFYKVNDKGQPVDEQGNPSTKVNNDGEPIDGNGNVIKPVDTSTNPLSTNLVNPNVTEPNKKTTSPTQLGNVTSGLQKYGDQVNGADVPGTNDKNRGLVDLSKPTTGEPKVSDNTAATVGDLRNMGWIVSADKTTGDLTKTYSDTVKNANEVKFVGEGTATVTGKTDDKGVRTITVKVDDQVSTNNAIMPTSFTTKDGKKVYPVKDDKGNVTYHTTPDGKGAGDTTIDPKNVVTAVSGPNGTTMPTTLQNVKSNLPNVDDKKQKAFHPDGTEVAEPNSTKNTGNAKAPLSHTVVAAMMSPFMTNEEGNFIDENGNVTTDPKQYVRNPNFAANNAATVSDVLNAGWNLQNNGESRDFVKPYDTVNFINGLGTTAVVTTREGNTTSDVTFNVKPANGSVTVDEDGVKVTTGGITSNPNGSVAGPTTPDNAKTLKDALDAAVKELATAKNALKTAETALAANPKDPALQKAVEDKKAEVAAKQTPVNDAQKAHDDAGLNKIATVQNVADAINNAGFNLKTSADGGEKLTTGTKNDGELIKPSNTVEMVAGKNLTVKQDENGKITYATKDNVTFTNVDTGTLNVGSPNTYTDGKGNTYTKVGDKYYKPADVVNGAPKQGATPVDVTTTPVTPVSPVTMKTEAAKPATNNATDAQPSSALNITSKDGKPTQITGVGSTLNVKPVDTNPNGTATTGNARPNLVDLVDTDKAPVNKNAAATVGDLQNMGWVVSTEKGNGYKDVVKNANQVDFKGGAGISVEGKTEGNVREITISVKDGEVVKPNQFTAKVNGTDTPVTKVGDQYYNTADIDPKTGEPKANVTPVTPDAGTTPTNAGDGYVTGNKVAAAIQKSGFVVGKQKDALSAADFKDGVEDEKVNPDDELRFADGNNTKVKLATKESVDKDGNKVTTTTVKVDVTGLPVQYTDKNGTPVTKVGDNYFTVDDKGNPTATEVKPADLTTNMVNPAAAPNAIGAPTTLGNVKSNLPSVNDADKNAKDVAGNPIDGKDNKSAPITAEKAADIVNKAGNNAATVSDVLNAGWNLQNNGEARDFVKPYDTVNFINGKGTKAVVETADNLTSTVKFDVDAGEITADTTKPGAVKGPVTADKAKKLADNLKKAEQAVKDLPANATEDKKAEAQKALKDAQAAAAPLNKVATAQNVADMINNSGFTLKTSATIDGKKKSGDDEVINPGKAVEMVAGKNLTVTQDKNGKVTYATANDVNFNSLSLGTSQHAPTLSAAEDGSLKLGSKDNQAPVRISNVAPGIKDGDAVNVSQLKGVTKDLEDKIDGVAAGSNAAASLPQVYLPGKSMVAASVGTYGSQGALAVGYSSISDNGKWLIKGQVNVNTKAKTGGGVGVGYLW